MNDSMFIFATINKRKIREIGRLTEAEYNERLKTGRDRIFYTTFSLELIEKIQREKETLDITIDEVDEMFSLYTGRKMYMTEKFIVYYLHSETFKKTEAV